MSPSPWRTERRAINCCNGCKPPKRYPGCGAHCEEYKEEKAQYLADKQREKEHKENHPTISNYDFNNINFLSLYISFFYTYKKNNFKNFTQKGLQTKKNMI